MERRGFLKTTVAVGLAFLAAGLGARAVYRALRSRAASNAQEDLERRLLERFDYLTLEPETVERFVADVEQHRPTLRLHPKGMPVEERFLMSTDFFQNGADESRRVAYVGFYHPYVTFCHNPLATRIGDG